MFTLLTDGDRSRFDDVLRIARPDDPVYVATRMLVGDLRWDMTAEWQRPSLPPVAAGR